MKLLRFSMRTLLVAFLVATVLLYVLVVRPTVVAKRFIAAMESGNYEVADALLTSTAPEPIRGQIAEIHNPTVEGEMSARRTGDLFRFERQLQFTVKPDLSDRKSRIGFGIEAVATPWGVKPPKFYAVTYSR